MGGVAAGALLTCRAPGVAAAMAAGWPPLAWDTGAGASGLRSNLAVVVSVLASLPASLVAGPGLGTPTSS